MNTTTLLKIFSFSRDALAGLGLLYLSQLAGWTNLTVQSLTITPEQAHAIQNDLSWGTEEIKPKRSK